MFGKLCREIREDEYLRKTVLAAVIVYVGTIVAFSLVYWGLSALRPHWGALRAGSNRTITDCWNCLYFSIITISSLGYGDIQPSGWCRAFACVEVIFGLAYVSIGIGLVISRAVGKGTDMRVRDINLLNLELALSSLSRDAEAAADRYCKERLGVLLGGHFEGRKAGSARTRRVFWAKMHLKNYRAMSSILSDFARNALYSRRDLKDNETRYTSAINRVYECLEAYLLLYEDYFRHCGGAAYEALLGMRSSVPVVVEFIEVFGPLFSKEGDARRGRTDDRTYLKRLGRVQKKVDESLEKAGDGFDYDIAHESEVI